MCQSGLHRSRSPFFHSGELLPLNGAQLKPRLTRQVHEQQLNSFASTSRRVPDQAAYPGGSSPWVSVLHALDSVTLNGAATNDNMTLVGFPICLVGSASK